MDALAQKPTSPEVKAIAEEAWIYAFPMMESYNTWYPQTVLKDSPTYVGGFNTFRHYSEAFTPENKDVVTPNNDTPYSWAWLDLRAEPIVISVPPVPEGRYYVLQFVDLFTYNCAYIGSRATGNGAGHYLMAGPDWKGTATGEFKKIFRSETQIVGTLGRTQLNGPDDVGNVKKVQSGFKLTPLSVFQSSATPPALSVLNFPPYEKAKASSQDFVGYLNFLLALAVPPHPSEVQLRERFAQIGIIPGKLWDAGKVDPATLAAIDAGVKAAQEKLRAEVEVTHSSNGLFGSRQTLGEKYLRRAVAACMGLYGNDLEEAWYGGFVADGGKLSTVRFAKSQLPPARFFWSVTLYTLPDRFLYANSMNRYSIGDRTKGLRYDTNGGLTIYIGHNSPGSDRTSNWLPAPNGQYSLVARVYGPSEAAQNGQWKLPDLVVAG